MATDKPEAKDVKSCGSCHVKEGEAQKEHSGKKAPFIAKKKEGGDTWDKNSVSFHNRCLKCHKAVAKADESKKDIKKCKFCHGR